MKQIYPSLSQLMNGLHISKSFGRVAGFIVITMLLNIPVFGADRYAVASGNWNATSTWSATLNGTSGASVPTQNDNVFIGGSYIVNIVSVDASCRDLSITTGAVLNGSASINLRITSNYTSSGNFNTNGINVILQAGLSQSIAGLITTGSITMAKTALTATFTGNVSASILIINGNGGTLNLGTSLTHNFSGGLTRTIGTLNGGTSILQLGGDINGTSPFTAASGTVEFNGSALQNINGGLAFNNLSVNNPAGVSINNTSTSINGVLNFLNGKVNTLSNVLVLGASASVINPSATKYVNGNLRKGISASTLSKNFEIGDNNYYTPVLLNFAGTTNATGSILVKTTSGDHPEINNSEINPSLSANRYWTLTNTGVTGITSYNAIFNFDAADVDGGANTSSFVVNRYILSTWSTPVLGTVTTTSTQATGLGLTEFGDFQVGEAAAALTACAFGANSNAGINVMPCITDITSVNGSDSLVSNSFASNQYFTLDVVKGFVYRIYTANSSSPASPLAISVYDEAFPSNSAIAFSTSNTGNVFTAANNVFLSFTSPVSGKLRVLINKRRDCASVLPNTLIVRAKVVGGANTEDNPLAAGTDSWVAHIYDGTNQAVLFDGTFSNYLGYYTQPETFDDEFGTSGNNDANCYAGIYSAGNIRASIKIRDFSVRYRMNSTKKGLYVVNIGSDDGSRLSIDGKLVYNDWVSQGYAPANNILFSLTGSSNLALDFFEGTGDDRMSFLNLTKLLANELSNNTTQSVCQGSIAAAIGGDTIVLPLPTNITRVATTGYQWSYSITAGGARTNIALATAATFTPNTSVAPFNVPGAYYIYRTVSLRSTNNVSPNPDTAVHVSNAAIFTVVTSAPIQTVSAASPTFCYGNSSNILLSSSTVGINYQLRNNANNAAIGSPVAGTGAAISLPTLPLYATTTFNVQAINTATLCTINMSGTPTISTTPDGGKSVSADFGLVCVGNSATVTVINADAGVRYLLRNDADNTPVGDTLTGVGDDLDLQIPVGYLVDPLTTFHVWAYDIASGCAGKLLDTVKIATQALSSPIFNIDQDFCSLDSGKVLLTPTNTTYSSYLWSTDSTSTSIIIQQSGLYSLTATDVNGCRTTKSVNVGQELLINGDFSLGRDIGYYTGYIWGPAGGGFPSNPQNNGYYTIANNARNTHNDFWGKDHTSKTGNFMIINGENSAKKVWYDTVIVEANTRYYFSAWAMSLNDKPPFSVMRFKINNVLVGDSAILPPGVSNNSNYGWRRFYGQWDSGPRDSTNNRIAIEIVNLVGGNSGNDFGVDDISFSKLSPVKFFGASVGNGGNSLCIGDTLKLTATLTGGANPILYNWSGPGGFTDTAAAPVILNAPGGWYYLTATEGRNCQSQDSIFIILADANLTGVSQGPYKCENALIMYVTGMVPNSINNTIYYNISGTGTAAGNKVATGVNADASGLGSFYISNLPNTYTGRTLSITGIFNGSCTKNITGVSTVLDVRITAAGWVGGTSGNWKDPYNWCPGVPNNARDVIIPTGITVYVNSGDTAICRDITLSGTASLKINNGGRLMLYQNITTSATGKIDAREGTIQTMRDNANQNLSGDNFVGRSISTLLLSNTNAAGKVTVTGDTLKILSALLFSNNIADLETSNKLVLASSDTATARVGVIPAGTGNAITGDFIVERYLRNGRKWRLLAAPTNDDTQSIKTSWLENGVDTTISPKGYGFWAFDTRADYQPRGFDAKGNNTSVKIYNSSTDAWDAVANTTSPIKNNQGYIVFVPGDRKVVFPNSGATILRTKGKLYRVTDPELSTPLTVSAGQFKVIGNPFASAIDMRSVTKTNLAQAYYVWDPSLTLGYGLGGIMTFHYDGANYQNFLASPIYPVGVHNNVESGIAFIVQGAAGGGSISFKEADKVSGSSPMPTMFTSGVPQGIRLNLNLAGTTPILLDGAMANFDDTYSNQVDEYDIRKMGTFGESVGLKRNNALLVIERRFIPAQTDTLHIDMTKMTVRNYQWEINSDNMDYPGREAFLIDRYLNTSTPVNLAGTTTVNFSIQNIPGSYAPDRFKIVFKISGSGPVPVTITSIAANRNNNKTVTVQWKVENELNLDQYLVERSIDGNLFVPIATQTAANNSGGRAEYLVVDNEGLNADLFYRIRANSISGQVQYSAIVKVSGIKTNPSISVYPNPVQGKQMNVRFSGVAAGTYLLSLVNAAGQAVYANSVLITNAGSTQMIQLNNATAAGHYQLLITSPDGTKTNEPIIIK